MFVGLYFEQDVEVEVAAIGPSGGRQGSVLVSLARWAVL